MYQKFIRFKRYKYLTGLNAWEIASYQDPDNIVVLNDGPSGLRKPLKNGFTEQQDVIQTVCLPTPSALAASFNKDACYLNGTLIAKECLHHNTNILLAPGVNIKLGDKYDFKINQAMTAVGGYNIALNTPDYKVKPSVLLYTDFISWQAQISLLLVQFLPLFLRVF